MLDSRCFVQVVVVVTLFVLAFGLAFYLLMSNKVHNANTVLRFLECYNA